MARGSRMSFNLQLVVSLFIPYLHQICSPMKFVPETVVSYWLEHSACIGLLFSISSLSNNLILLD
jgi:hypothetical protein